MKTRNPNDEEIDCYDALCSAIEAAKLEMQSFELDLRTRYELGTDVQIDTNGYFIAANGQRIRQKPKPGAPESLSDRLQPLERKGLVVHRTMCDRAVHERDRYAYELKKACSAPHFARLDTQWRWVSEDGPRPIVPAEPETQEDDDETSEG